MTEFEQRAVKALLTVKVPAKNSHGAQIESLYMRLTLTPEKVLGLTEQTDLWFLVWRYRRQIEDREVVVHADELMNGARSLAF